MVADIPRSHSNSLFARASLIIPKERLLQIAQGLVYHLFSIQGDMPASTVKVVLLGNSGVGKTCLRSQFVHHVFTNGYKATIGGDYLTAQVTVTGTLTEGRVPEEAASVDEGDGSTGKDASKDRITAFGGGVDAATEVFIPAKTSAVGAQTVLPNARLDEGAQPPKTVQNTSQKIPQNTPQTFPQTVNLQIWDTAGQERFNSISQAFYRGTDVCVLVYDITNYELVLSLREWFSRFMEHSHVERPGVLIVGNKIDRAADRVVDMEEVREIILANTTVSVENYVLDWDTDLCEITCKKRDLAEKVFLRVGELALARLNGADETAAAPNRILGFDTIDLDGQQKAHSSGCAC